MNIEEGQRATKANKKALGTNSNPHNTIVKEPKNNIKINKAELKGMQFLIYTA